jgi:hypothetical protein
MKQKRQEKKWLQRKGYIHLTGRPSNAQIELKLSDPKRIARHAFQPLLFKTIRERRYKRLPDGSRGHKWKDENGEVKHNAKNRPIHYASHIDAAIYSYYSSEVIGKAYEARLKALPELSGCVTAYRKAPEGVRGKNNVHFAKEVFDFIKGKEDCVAIAIDIENFFSSLNHKHLKRCWCDILGLRSLPNDHFNIYKSVTNFSYVKLDNFRRVHGGFDEYALHLNRRKGVKAFFASPEDMREAIKKGDLRVYKNQFVGNPIDGQPTRGQKKVKQGIPQGLALSATLANLYMLAYDEIILKLVNDLGGLYRRYSDDIAVICQYKDLANVLHKLFSQLEVYGLKASIAKTEICHFTKNGGAQAVRQLNPNEPFKVTRSRAKFTYLGFSFDGQRVRVKDKNISKFYRRMKYAVKRKIRRAAHGLTEEELGCPV